MLPSLRELQRSFATGVLHDDVTTVGGLLVPGDFSGESRLQIYRNNVFTSLTDALKDIYPVVARLVGNEFFSYTAHEYIVRYPSRSGNLHEFGDRLPGFLGGFPPAKDLGYLADVAHLEWTWHEVFHAADHPPLSLEKLRQIPVEQYPRLHFKLHPASQIVSSRYPILRIWQVNQDNYVGDETVELDCGGDKLLVIRPELEVLILPLGDGEFALLDTLSRGAAFEKACQSALEKQGNLDITACLQKHVITGTLVDFDIQ